MISDKAYDTIMVLLAFLEMVILAIMIAVITKPTCLDSAYMFSIPDTAIVDETMHKNPDTTTLKKERYYLSKIANLSPRTPINSAKQPKSELRGSFPKCLKDGFKGRGR